MSVIASDHMTRDNEEHYIVKNKRALSLISFVILIAFMQPIQAERFYSVASLTLLCGNKSPSRDAECKVYLHGVVETWMLKDVVSVEPYRYSSRGNEPTFCETINKVSENEWLNIVREKLNTMGPGLAADAVMEVLSAKLCK